VTERQGSAQLRILAVTNLWPVGQSFRGIFVQEQVNALRRLGLHVDVEVVAQDRGRADYLLAARRVRRRARAGDYDLAHVHYGLTTFAARWVTWVPQVLTLYGSDVNVRWQRRLTRLGSGRINARIYLSRRTAVANGEPSGIVIPNGVDFSLFAPMDQSRARAALGIGSSEKVVLFGGHPDNQIKGYDVFTDVLAKVRRRGIPVRELILAEPGQSRSGVPLKFAAADVLLFTSRRGFESSPTVVKEAAAMGLPVVTVAVGDVAETLSGVEPSAVVEFPNPWGAEQARNRLAGELADRVADVLLSDARSNGRECTARLDSEREAEQIVQVYRQVLSSTEKKGATLRSGPLAAVSADHDECGRR
jgi:teichuronic acid biosynthesis glycosyltransferase TuaC